MKRITLAVAAWSVLAAGPLALAEDALTLQPGARVRVSTNGAGGFAGTFQGTVARLDSETMTLVDSDRGGLLTVPTPSITRLQVSAGRQRRFWKGLVVGAALGAALGAFVGSVDDGTGNGCGLYTYEPCNSATAAKYAGQTAVAGALWGAGIGFFVRTERWRESRVDAVRVTVAPTRGGARVGVAVAF